MIRIMCLNCFLNVCEFFSAWISCDGINGCLLFILL